MSASSVSEIEVYLVKPHPTQQELLDNRKRFNVLKCGRRWGKTELAQELISEVVQTGGIVAYYAPTYKDLYEVWKAIKRTFYDIIEHKDEQVKQITFLGGAVLDCWSMDDPDSGRGRKYHRVIMDECEKVDSATTNRFQESWENAVRATLVDYKGDAYFLSTPKFGDTYFKKMAKYEASYSDWKTFTYTTYQNPHINKEEIDEAIALDPIVGACEYLAEDLDGKAVNPFCHQFDPDYHVSSSAVHIPQKRLIISIDFNLNPFAVTFSHFWRDRDGIHQWVFDEASIENGSIPEMVDLIRERYSNSLHTALITGDAMGKQRDISQRDNASLYEQLRRGLRVAQNQLKVYPNPTHENSRSDVNWMLFHTKGRHEFIISPRCAGTIYDMKYVQADAYGHILKRDRKKLNQKADFLDTIRYSVNAFWKEYIK